MVRILLFLCLVIAAAGCSTSYVNEQAFYYEDGRPKPVVTVVSVIDRSQHHLPWNLSDEFTFEICDCLLKKEKLFFKISPQIKENLLETDFSWIKSQFPKTEFVVFMELIQHEEIPLTSEEENSPAELHIALQLYVIDLRNPAPTTILKELFHNTQYLPKHFTHSNFLQIPWGKETYPVTPIGQAHETLVRQVSERIENYITEIANHGL
jgi:hypothetical protein